MNRIDGLNPSPKCGNMTGMDPTLASTYADPTRHAAISRMLRRRSTNSTDVRDALLVDLDLGVCRRILDLGCGFGFMASAVGRRCAPGAEIIGVDVCEANADVYLEHVTATGCYGHFVCQRLDSTLAWPDETFDLVLASYSLYFFPNLLPEIARVLASEGLFLTVTHTRACARSALALFNISEDESPLLAVTDRFCAENASALLEPWFAELERLDYPNALLFEPAHREELRAYVEFKLPFLIPAAKASDALVESLVQIAFNHGEHLLLKNDAVAFRGRSPRCRQNPSTARSAALR